MPKVFGFKLEPQEEETKPELELKLEAANSVLTNKTENKDSEIKPEPAKKKNKKKR